MTAGACIVCVDFGTAWSKAAAAPPGAGHAHDRVRPLALAPRAEGASPLTLASALFLSTGQVHFGDDALNAAAACDPNLKREALLSFKTLLSARDLEHSLTYYASKRIDPNGAFRHRDLIVLYLGYLQARVHAAMAADATLAPYATSYRLRYAQPGWPRSETSARNALIARLFDEAEALARECAPSLVAGAPLSVDVARAALDRAAASNAPSRVDGGVLEATAAAACHTGAAKGPMGVTLVDIGAGTTDIGGFLLTPGAAHGFEDIAAARQTLDLAGDAIDRMLMNLLLDKARGLKTTQAKAAAWRTLLLQVRAAKESIFRLNKAAIRVGDKIITIQARELSSLPEFKAMEKQIKAGFAKALEAAAERAQDLGAREVWTIAAGGGANLPFVRELIRTAKPKRAKMKMHPAPLAPEWANAPAFQGQLAPVFPQLSIALGGAVAPDGLITR